MFMAAAKLLQNMRKNPIGWRIEELQAVRKNTSLSGADRAVAAAT